METPSELLRRARGLAELTQQQVADALGIDRSLLAGYETGRRTPSLAMLERLLEGSGFELELGIRPIYREPAPEDDYAALAKRSPADRIDVLSWGLLGFVDSWVKAGIDAAFDGAIAARMQGIPVPVDLTEIVVPFGVDELQMQGIGAPVDEYGLTTVNRLPRPAGQPTYYMSLSIGHVLVRPVGFSPSQMAIELPVHARMVPVLPLHLIDPDHALVGPALQRLRALADRQHPPLPTIG